MVSSLSSTWSLYPSCFHSSGCRKFRHTTGGTCWTKVQSPAFIFLTLQPILRQHHCLHPISFLHATPVGRTDIMVSVTMGEDPTVMFHKNTILIHTTVKKQTGKVLGQRLAASSHKTQARTIWCQFSVCWVASKGISNGRTFAPALQARSCGFSGQISGSYIADHCFR